MHRARTIVVVLALLAGSVPAAATLADGTPSDIEPGASFSGVVGIQESEVNSEVADRSLDQRLNAAETNGSKASVVADQSNQLADRLAELEAGKEQLNRAYENGSSSRGEYQARLAVLSAELRAVERRANKTATAAEGLPEQALREKGANVSAIRAIAQQANRTGGGEVAEAARNIAGGGVSNGLGNAPNATQGPPADRGNDAAPVTTENETDRKPADAGQPSDAGNNTNAPADTGDSESPASNASNGSNVNETTAGTESDAANRSTGNADGSDRSAAAGNGSAGVDGTETPTTTENGQNNAEFATPTDWLAGGIDGAISGVSDVFSDVPVTAERGTTLG